MRIKAKCIAYNELPLALRNKWLISWDFILTIGIGIFMSDLKTFFTTNMEQIFWKRYLPKVCHVHGQEKYQKCFLHPVL